MNIRIQYMQEFLQFVHDHALLAVSPIKIKRIVKDSGGQMVIVMKVDHAIEDSYLGKDKNSIGKLPDL
jgi:hypothetical protein